MKHNELVTLIADLLKNFDYTKPVHKAFQPGIGPFGEPQLIMELSKLLKEKGYETLIKRMPDLIINNEWALEFKIARPFGNNGEEDEHWSVNLLRPYSGNTSAIGGAIKLNNLMHSNKAIFMIGYEHEIPKISLNPLFDSFELIAKSVMKINLSERVEEKRNNL